MQAVIHIAPVLGGDPASSPGKWNQAGKKAVVYSKCCHGHMELVPLWEFQEDQLEEQEALTLLAKRMSKKHNSAFPGNLKLCHCLL